MIIGLNPCTAIDPVNEADIKTIKRYYGADQESINRITSKIEKRYNHKDNYKIFKCLLKDKNINIYYSYGKNIMCYCSAAAEKIDIGLIVPDYYFNELVERFTPDEITTKMESLYNKLLELKSII